MSKHNKSFVHTLPVTINVGTGPGQRTYYGHRGCLEETSGYFDTEAQDAVCNFKKQEDDPDAMEMFVQWQYQPIEEITSAVLSETTRRGYDTPMGECLIRHARAFVLGDRLRAPEFQKDVVRGFYNCFTTHTATAEDLVDMPSLIDAATIVYEWTTPESGWAMRKLLALYCALRMGYGAAERIQTWKVGAEFPWTEEDRNSLATSRLDEFLADILGEAFCRELNSEVDLEFLLGTCGA